MQVEIVTHGSGSAATVAGLGQYYQNNIVVAYVEHSHWNSTVNHEGVGDEWRGRTLRVVNGELFVIDPGSPPIVSPA